MKTAVLIALAAFAGSCANCSDTGAVGDPDPWMVGEDDPDGGAEFIEAGPPIDLGPAGDDGPPPPPPPPPDGPPTCVDAETSVFQAPGSDFVFGPVVADDRVFVTGRTLDEPVERLLEWTVADGLIRRGDDSIMGGIIAFDDQFVWTSDVDGNVSRLELVTNELQPLPGVEVPYRSVAWGYEYAPVRRTADGRRFGWQSQGVVNVANGSSVAQLATDGAGSPWVHGEAVAYAFNDVGGTSIRVHLGEDFFEFGREGSRSSWPVVTDRAVFFVHDGEVRRVVSDGSNNEVVLRDRFCGPLHADRNTAVTACAPMPPPDGSPGADYLSLQATEVWAFESGTGDSTLVATTDAPVYAPIVSPNWIVWTEYDGDLGGQPAVVGRIMVLPRGEGGEPTEVAQMGAGCPYCGAYWPPPRLVLGENTVAWNYAFETEPDPEMFGPRGSYGVARLSECD